MVRLLLRAGHRVSVVDNLSSGVRGAVPADATFVQADVRDRVGVRQLMEEQEIEAVFHFAARIQVGESVSDPRLYYGTNVGGSLALLESVLDAGVRIFVFSSTAAVYGDPQTPLLAETHRTAPVNPYGETKLTVEKALASYARAYALRYAALRYFNAAGADEAGGIGEAHEPETHLVPLVLDAALGRRAAITVYGDDYATPDGTCVRDYIHVSDLAEAHLAALHHLVHGGASGAFNLGTGRGHSVREVIAAVARVTGKEVPVQRGARRDGDPDVLVAAVARAREVLGWTARRARARSDRGRRGPVAPRTRSETRVPFGRRWLKTRTLDFLESTVALRGKVSMFDNDVLCLSHLRWHFVFQRPNHLMCRAAREQRVFFVEEPMETDGVPGLDISCPMDDLPRLSVVVPRVRAGSAPEEVTRQQRELLDLLVAEQSITRPVLWMYTPMALEVVRHLETSLIVYDCMDELSQFDMAPPCLRAFEAELFGRADLVFTGGQSLYEAKRHHHANVHAFPSSVDAAHFARSRRPADDPPDQRDIPRPRVGFFGVIDERLDVRLLADLARNRPDLELVMIGPVVKVDAATLPSAPNLHWLGCKAHGELPSYIGGWDVAMMPFARNRATEFISPTKTLEFLAAGKPVVSTAIRDVVRPYGHHGLVRIADDAAGFARAIDAALAEPAAPRLAKFDAHLAGTSWDRTWSSMRQLCAAASEARPREPAARRAAAAAPPSGLRVPPLAVAVGPLTASNTGEP